MTRLYSPSMKTAVSIPDPIFAAADELAARLGISRSELYARALERELAAEDDQQITARLDAVYGALDSRVDGDLDRAQRTMLHAADW
jgi:metal-responsive CopG/Arc/MetJ family transcriptional regulator